MEYLSDTEDKINLIRQKFSKLIGGEIRGYEFAQMWVEEEQEWSDWMDIPLFITINDSTVSISWT